MAFTLRLDEKHEQILEALGSSLGLNAKNKIVLYLVENFVQVRSERDNYFQEMNKAKRELNELKALLLDKRKVEEKLNDILQIQLN